MVRKLFFEAKSFIGVVHLAPLPGSPRWGGDMGAVLSRAQEEARTLDAGGVHGIIVENFGDAPFRIGRVEPETVSAMTLAVEKVRQITNLPVGINMLRNDAVSAMAVAAVTGAAFIRVNVHYGVVAADEGLVEGEAHRTLRQRQALGVDVKILADVMVKHATPLGTPDLSHMVRETLARGLADGLIISGPATGAPTRGTDVETARRAAPDAFILVGSGIDESNAAEVLARADGAIVGTSLKQDRIVSNPVDPDRVKRLAAVLGQSPWPILRPTHGPFGR